MASQTLFLLLLGAVQIFGAPVDDLPVSSGKGSPVAESPVSHREGRLIPLLIYDNGKGKSHLAPGSAVAARNAESLTSEAALAQTQMNAVNLNAAALAGDRALKLPALAAGLLTLGTLNNSSFIPGLNIPGLQSLINQFPFLGNLSSFFPFSQLVGLTRTQGLYLYTPFTGLIPISNYTMRSKTGREESIKPTADELIQNIYKIYELSLLQQQSLALQQQSVFGNPWQSLPPFNPQAYNPLPFNQHPYSQGSFNSFPYSGPIPYQPPYSQGSFNSFPFSGSIPYLPASNPFANSAVQSPGHPSVPLSMPGASELPFQLLKEVTVPDLVELDSQKNKVEGTKAAQFESTNDDEKNKVLVMASEDPLKMNTAEGTPENASPQQETDHNNAGELSPTASKNHASQLSL